MLRDDLLRRSSSHMPNDLGALLRYQIVTFETGQFFRSNDRLHAYLFETAIVVMSDSDVGFHYISMDTWLVHPLELRRLVYLSDVKTVVPSHPFGSSLNYTYGLALELRNEGADLALWFTTVSSATDWTTAIRRLQYRCGSEKLNSAETEDIAAFESFAVAMQVFQWQLEISHLLGRVLHHGTVIVHKSEESTGVCQLVLFDNALVFLQGSPADAKRHLLASPITSIVKTTTDDSTGIELTYCTEFDDCIQFEEFRFEPTTDIDIWLHMLHTFAPNASTQHDVHQNLRLLAQKYEQTKPARRPGRPSTSVAGLAMLHATSISDELNISIAVLPSFESTGLATRLIAYLLEEAFERFGAHRIQARVAHSALNPAQTARTIRLLIHLGFTHEGVRRRAAHHPNEGQWVDVSVLAMLELDWVRRADITPPKGTLWDEMFARQQREREMLLKIEGPPMLKRTRSMETVRDLRSMNDAVPSASMVSSSVGCPTITSDTASQASVPTTMFSWDGISDDSSQQIGGAKRPRLETFSSADDAADEYEEWDLEEDYSDDENEDEEMEP